MQSGGAAPGAMPASSASDEPTLDQPNVKPIGQQVARRSRTDEAATRRLLQQAADARAASTLHFTRAAPYAEGDPVTIVWLLLDTARLWRKHYDRAVRNRIPGMTRARCTVLVQLAQCVGVNQAALARILDIEPMTLVRLLDRLEAAGLVARMPDPQDGRAHVLALTAKALPLIEQIYDLTRRIDGEAQIGMSSAEIRRLLALLDRVRANLSARAGGVVAVERCGRNPKKERQSPPQRASLRQ
jgi:MarR family transcriptional regulator for hemolysin